MVTSSVVFRPTASLRRGSRLHLVQFLGFGGLEQSDADQVERADELAGQPEATGPEHRIASSVRLLR